MVRYLLSLILAITLVSCRQGWEKQVSPEMAALVKESLAKAGDHAGEIQKALDEAPEEQKKGMAFLVAYMPDKDLKTLTSSFLLDNAAWAYKARETFPWCRNLPEDIFFNEVMPYANLEEDRDNWRPVFYERFQPYVSKCTNIYEAIDSVNRNIEKELGVEYNTKRSRVDISPLQSIKEKMATCTGLSFLLIDAFRSVGIPARLAGTAMWTNMRGNHSWVEVWIDGKWYFTEYYPDALNKSWFLADAGKADPAKPLHWICAVTYKPGDWHFPMSWARNDTTVHAVNVTDRYISLYREQLEKQPLHDDEVLVDVVLYRDGTSEGGADGRLHRKVSVRADGQEVTFGFTPSPTDDLNRYLVLKLKKGQPYTFAIFGDDGKIEREVERTTSSEPHQIIRLTVKD
jgi:hypothetical protein